ncbi:ABC transporter permease [Rhizobiaceae bacterium CRRU44]|uniref:ABC transporter permease n=2 Tax=Hyphomicrobiales TaxID=356 RepID=A0AA44CEW8_9HYPH|nr:ABC transporter permease [Ferranicluibacter rubi]
MRQPAREPDMEAVLDSASSDETPGLGRSRLLKVAVPAIMLGLTLLAWEVYVRVNAVPPYILPAPSLVAQTLVKDWGTLYPALLVTLRITFSALILALIGGTVLAVLLVQSKWVELALYPYAVILQVTPIVAIAPLILVYVSSTQAAIMICAFLVAFFPILSNMVQGLKSVDHNLLNLYDLYGASRWQQLRLLKLPAALPYFMTGLKIGGGLSLIAAVVAEFAAGSAGAGSGLAFRLLEAQYRLNIPRLFAALVLLSATGVAIFALTSVVAWLSLRRWHESALAREN